MAEQPQSPPNVVQGFRGLNNRLDPTRLGLEWQLQATNALCDDAGYLLRRPGLSAFLSGFKDVYGTRSGRLLAITDGDGLVELTGAGDVVPWHTGVTGGPFQWVELGYALFLMSDSAQWAVYPDRVIPWGSLCPAAATETYPVGEPVSYPPPVGSVLGSYRASIAIGVWEPNRDRSVVFYTRPDFPHEVRLERDFVLVPGRITLLAGVNDGLLIGTDRAIFADGLDGGLQKLVDYGVWPGPVFNEQGQVHFWTARGLCRFAPFENLTEAALAPELRESAVTGLLPVQGSQYAVIQQTGEIKPPGFHQPYAPLTISTTRSQGVS
jgi:hypothetical protein